MFAFRDEEATRGADRAVWSSARARHAVVLCWPWLTIIPAEAVLSLLFSLSTCKQFGIAADGSFLDEGSHPAELQAVCLASSPGLAETLDGTTSLGCTQLKAQRRPKRAKRCEECIKLSVADPGRPITWWRCARAVSQFGVGVRLALCALKAALAFALNQALPQKPSHETVLWSLAAPVQGQSASLKCLGPAIFHSHAGKALNSHAV